MKSKKLFAILTLVAFMMTLVPAMAFGDPTPVTYSATGSKVVDVDNATLKVGKTATITVEFRDGSKNLLVSTPITSVFVKTSRDGVSVTAIDASSTGADVPAVFEDDGVEEMTGLYTNADGCIEFEVESAFAEEYVISFWNTDAGADDEISINKIGEAIITFTSTSTSVDSVKLTATGDGFAGDEVKLTARVEDGNNNGLSGKVVTFYKKKGDSGSYASIGTATTNSIGKAEFKYDETEAGDFYYKAKCGGEEGLSGEFTVEPGEPLAIEAKTADGKIFDVDKDDNLVSFEVTDYYGNKIDTATLVVTITSAPKGSDLEDEPLSDITYDPDDEEYDVVFDPDEEGDYTIKAKISGTGIFTTVKVTAKEAGETDEIIVRFLEDEETALIADDNKADEIDLEVVAVDENGIEFDADDFKAYTSNVKLAKIKTIDTSAGTITLEGPKDADARGVATITVVDLETGATASLDVPIVGKPYAIDADYTVSGKVASVTLQFVDDEGAVTANRAKADDYEILLPEGVVVTDKKLFAKENGIATFKATVDEYGTYELTVVSEQGIAKSFEIAVGEAEEDEPAGSGAVTMFIGSTGYVVNGVPMISDVAPFIKDGRTFVAVRPIANAFGVLPENIGWNEATQTVTLTRDDVTVTVVIGSSDIEVVEDGVVSTVTADVPAFIENGRTVLPFRAVGEAFGATVSWDEATQSVTYEL